VAGKSTKESCKEGKKAQAESKKSK